MCLIVFSHLNHEKYKLVVAANRDEFYERPTLAANYWKDHPEILGGLDLTAGGTWMGVTQKGKISMLTNYRDLKNISKDAPSRGHLVSDFLKNGDPGKEYLQTISENGKEYNGYNLVSGTFDELYYLSNYDLGIKKIESGIYGLSNELLDSPWPKVESAKNSVESLIRSEFDAEDLLELMYNDDRFPDSSLPETGVGIEMERMLSSMFIKSPKYGSRCSTVITVDWDNKVDFRERTYNTTDFSYTDKEYKFKAELS